MTAAERSALIAKLNTAPKLDAANLVKAEKAVLFEGPGQLLPAPTFLEQNKAYILGGAALAIVAVLYFLLKK